MLTSTIATAGASPPKPAPVYFRIVSLIPSLTEDLFAIGAGSRVIGISSFVDYPPQATKLPQVATFSSVDAERIVRMHPDLVVGIPSEASLVTDLRRAGLNVRLLPDDSFESIFTNLATLGAWTGRGAEAARLANTLRAKTQHIEAAIAHAHERVPSVFVVLGISPIITVGPSSYIARLISFAGGHDAASNVQIAYGPYGEESLLALQPDIVIADNAIGISSVLDRAPWTSLRAVQQKHVFILDNPDILERPSPRYVEGLEWLAAHFHPDVSLH